MILSKKALSQTQRALTQGVRACATCMWEWFNGNRTIADAPTGSGPLQSD